MGFLLIALLVIAAAGHLVVWIAFVNRLHSTALPHRTIKGLAWIAYAMLALVPLATVAAWYAGRFDSLGSRGTAWLLAYLALCAGVALIHYPRWLWRRLSFRPAEALVAQHATTVDVAERLGRRPVSGWPFKLWARLPGNQLLRVEVREVVLALPRLPAALDGLSIVHLSDTHFSGRIDPDYFHEVAELTNRLQPDLIALTGDLCDRRRCIDWIPQTLGRLAGRLGTFYVLGNHDLRVIDVARLRATLAAAGLTDVAAKPQTLLVHGQQVLLAGNERPWFPLADEIERAWQRSDGEPFRILLAHSPDQFAWARAHDFDLMLVGHTHGGQIRFPWIGPVLCPCRSGVQYASGVFEQPPTVMFVNRGISSMKPIRLNCPPEIVKLVLVRRR